MASWQAYLATWLVKLTFKQRFARAAGNMRRMRQVMTPLPFRIPHGVSAEAAEIGGVQGEWVEAGPSELTLVYLHGGGYFACSAQTHRPITVGYAQQGLRVFAPNYRLAPEARFPAALDDALAVYRGLLKSGIPAGRIAISGESAGGALALSLILALREAGDPLPSGAALFSPWTDLAGTGESTRFNDRRCAMFTAEMARLGGTVYLGETDPRNPLASPFYADFAGLPPLLIHVGKDEVLLDDSRRVAEKARAAGVQVEFKIWPVVSHAWQLGYPMIPEARQSISEAAVFLKRAVGAVEQTGVPAQ